MGAQIAGSVLVFAFGALLVFVGAFFYRRNKVGSYSGVVQGVILVLGGVLILVGSGWFWWAVEQAGS